MLQSRIVCNRGHAVGFICIVIGIYFMNEAMTHPLRDPEKNTHLKRDKRDLDILAECDTECLPEHQIKDYDLLLYYEYEEETEYTDEYGFTDYITKKEKSCMYRCIIVGVNETNEMMTDSSSNLEGTTDLNIDPSTEFELDNQLPEEASDNGTASNSSVIGNRFRIVFEQSNPAQNNTTTLTPSIMSSSSEYPSTIQTRAKPPNVFVPKKLTLTVLEAEMMEARLEPPPHESSSTKATETIPREPDNIDNATSVTLMNINDGTEEINYRAKTEQSKKISEPSVKQPFKQENTALIERTTKNKYDKESSNFLNTMNDVEKTTINHVGSVKIPYNVTKSESGQLLINNSEVKCIIYLVNENFPGESTTSGKDLDVTSVPKALEFTQGDVRTKTTTDNALISNPTTIKPLEPLNYGTETTTDNALISKPITIEPINDRIENILSLKTISSKIESNTLKYSVEPKGVNDTTEQSEANNITLNLEVHKNITNFTDEKDPSTVVPSTIHGIENSSDLDEDGFVEIGSEISLRSLNEPIYNPNNTNETKNNNFNENVTYSTIIELETQKNNTESSTLFDILTSGNISLPDQIVPTTHNILNLHIDNYSFQGTFTSNDDPDLPQQLQKVIAENLRKVDNKSTIIVSPQTKSKLKAVTKLDKVD